MVVITSTTILTSPCHKYSYMTFKEGITLLNKVFVCILPICLLVFLVNHPSRFQGKNFEPGT